jgi:hypothetical protein
MKTDFIITTILGNGKTLKPVIRKTEKGISDYANKMYRKYGDDVTVEVDYLDDNFNLKRYCTYHA